MKLAHVRDYTNDELARLSALTLADLLPGEYAEDVDGEVLLRTDDVFLGDNVVTNARGETYVVYPEPGDGVVRRVEGFPLAGRRPLYRDPQIADMQAELVRRRRLARLEAEAAAARQEPRFRAGSLLCRRDRVGILGSTPAVVCVVADVPVGAHQMTVRAGYSGAVATYDVSVRDYRVLTSAEIRKSPAFRFQPSRPQPDVEYYWKTDARSTGPSPCDGRYRYVPGRGWESRSGPGMQASFGNTGWKPWTSGDAHWIATLYPETHTSSSIGLTPILDVRVSNATHAGRRVRVDGSHVSMRSFIGIVGQPITRLISPTNPAGCPLDGYGDMVWVMDEATGKMWSVPHDYCTLL